MADGNPAGIEQQYVIHNVKAISQILADLLKQKTTLKVSFNNGNDVYLTSVIALDTVNHAVFLDIGRDEAFNARLLASHNVTFEKDDGIRIHWVSKRLVAANMPDGKAIKIAQPQSMVRLQRREYFRINTPITTPVLCFIPMPDPKNPNQEKTLELKLVNISIGGVGVTSLGALDPSFRPGATFSNCKMDFPDIGMTNVKLQVMSMSQIPMIDGTIKHRIGLSYVDPSRGNEGLIHRYTYMLERAAMAIANDDGVDNTNG
jgi:c-di-GMP-binding flagellar brake protein YcgR